MIGTCTDAQCPDNEQCVSSSTFDCQCEVGFGRNETGLCVDTDECLNNENNCHKNADCLNMEGSYKCSCKNGFYGDGESCLVGKCLDLNCGQNRTCVSSTSSDCKCMDGYRLDQGTGNCFDVDECESGCSNAKCVNTLGSYYCLCNRGYKKDGEICRQAGAVLVLHDGKPSALINSTGDLVDFNCFQMDANAQLERACATLWKDEVYLFGAPTPSSYEYKQISRLDGYKLNVVGHLTFSHYNGACSVMGKKFIFLCFGMNSHNQYQCYRATDPLGSFIKVARSNIAHMDTRTSASTSKYASFEKFFHESLDELLALGGFAPSHSKAHYFDNFAGKWVDLEDYPFAV